MDVETEVEAYSLVPSQLGGALLEAGRLVSSHLGPLAEDDTADPVGLIFRILMHKTRELSSILKAHPTSSQTGICRGRRSISLHGFSGDVRGRRIIFGEELCATWSCSFSMWL